MTIIDQDLVEPHANGNQPGATPDLDGLCYLGTLVAITPAKFKGTDDTIPGLANAAFTSSQGDFKVNLSKTAKQMTGDVELPAFDKLVQAMPGTKWIVKLWRTTSAPDANGKTYQNYTAVDATRA
jgi:hypothetical protein